MRIRPLRRPWAAFQRSTVRMRAATSRSLTVGNGPLPWRAGRGTGTDRCTEPYPGRAGQAVSRGDPGHRAGEPGGDTGQGEGDLARAADPWLGRRSRTGGMRVAERSAGRCQRGRRLVPGRPRRWRRAARGWRCRRTRRGGSAGSRCRARVLLPRSAAPHDRAAESARQIAVPAARPAGRRSASLPRSSKPAGLTGSPVSQRRRRHHCEVAARCRRAAGSAASTSASAASRIAWSR